MKNLFRQGDVLLVAIQSIDLSVATPKSDECVAYGEHSGHAHVATGDAHVFELDGKLYVSVGTDGGNLEHLHLPTGKQADHLPLQLEPGYYEVVMQNQYNPFTKLMEQVID